MYAFKANHFSSMTGIISSDYASNQSVEAFCFLPNAEIALLQVLLVGLSAKMSSRACVNAITLSGSRVLVVSMRGRPSVSWGLASPCYKPESGQYQSQHYESCE